MMTRTLAQRIMRLAVSRRSLPRPHYNRIQIQATHPRFASISSSHLSSSLYNSNKTPADIVIEEITELYATAQDEFEIAMEETEKSSVYAQADRDAAREELGKVQEAYRRAIEGGDAEVAEEVKRRIGHRIRELEGGVERMEAMAVEHD